MEQAQFAWLGSTEDEFAALEENYRHGVEQQVNINIDFGHFTEKRHVVCVITATIFCEEKLVVRARLNSLFEISEDSWSARIAEDQQHVQLERELLRHFAVFTLGTLRGYILARVQSYPIRTLLPPINVYQLMEEMKVPPVALSN
jgi:hypothetical protein